MSLFLYEVKKTVLSKSMWGILLILLAANIFTCVIFAKLQMASEVPYDIAEEFFGAYIDDPERVNDDYQEYLKFMEEQNALLDEALRNGDFDFTPVDPPNKYAGEGFSDLQLYDLLFSYVANTDGYGDVIEKVVEQAKTKMIEYKIQGIAEDTYVYEYQKKIISIYKNMPEYVSFDIEFVRGWDIFFKYEAVNVYIVISVIIVCSVLFTREKYSGILPILRVSKRGRVQTALAKISVSALSVAVIVLLFTLTTWGAVGITAGYSSMDNAIQAVNGFLLCPYIMTVGQYFLIFIVNKYLTIIVFSSVVILISVCFNNYIFNYICSLGVLGLNILLDNYNYLNGDNIFKNLNLLNTSAVFPLFERYSALNVMGNTVHYVSFMTVVFTAAFILCSVFSVVLYSRNGGVINFKQGLSKNLPAFRMKAIGLPGFGSGIKPIFVTELFKSFISSGAAIAVVVLLIIKIVVSDSSFQPPAYYIDGAYKEYMLYLSGDITDEKREYIASEREYIDDTLERYIVIMQDYDAGKVTLEEMEKYLSEYNYANNHNVPLKRVESHVSYIDRLENEGKEAWFVYDTGWLELFFSDFDWMLYAAILLCFSGVFSFEYNKRSSDGAFADILRTTKYGRHKTFKCKYLSSFSAALLMAFVWNVVDLINVINTNTLDMLDAPIHSIEALEGLPCDMTVWQYVILFYAVRFMAAVLLACVACSLSVVLKKPIPVLTFSVIITLMPSLLVRFGISWFEKISYVSVLRGTPMLVCFDEMWVYLLGVTAVCLLLFVQAERVWNK
jgi:hypothetical protein